VKNHYAVLGVHPSATIREIRSRYRQLVLSYHPDRNKDPAAAKFYADVREAYEILSNTFLRAQYDRKNFFDNRPDKQNPVAGFANIDKIIVLDRTMRKSRRYALVCGILFVLFPLGMYLANILRKMIIIPSGRNSMGNFHVLIWLFWGLCSYLHYRKYKQSKRELEFFGF
jgi:curved DNA-binding protein CbpA